jgi:hypothetical protein
VKKPTLYFLFFLSLLPLFGQRRWKAAGVPVSLGFSFAENQLLASDGAGGAIVAWMDTGRKGYGLYAQRLNARGIRLWGDRGVVVYTGNPGGQNFAMTADGAGGVIFAWEGNSDIFAQRINAVGKKLWGANGTAVCLDVNGQISPMLTADGSGGAIVVWHDFRLASSSDIFAQRLDAHGRRSWAADGIPICSAANVDSLGSAISDGAGGAIFFWEDYRAGTDANIFAQRVDGAGNLLWRVDGMAVCSDPAIQLLPRAVADGANGAIVIWSDVRSGVVDIYAQRIDSSGNGIWPANGIPIASRSNDQYEAAIIGDGFGGAVIAWIEGLIHDASYHDVYAQRLDPAGSPLWTTAGIPVCVTSGNKTGPNLVADQTGGAIIAWLDGRTLGPTRKIYASKLDALGGPQWEENGILVSLNNNNQYQPRLVSDGWGGAIVSWQDVKSTVAAIYAQRLSPVYAVDFSAGEGGKITGKLSQKVFSGASCTLVEAFPKAGYRFSSWSGMGGFYTKVNPLRVTRVSENMIIQANFIKKASILEPETP